VPLGDERTVPTSKEIQQRLDLARTELEKSQQQLVESKTALIQKLREAFPGFVDSAIRRLVEKSASRIDQMSPEELRKMKMEIEKEKPKAIENALKAFDSSPGWLWCPSSATGYREDPIDDSGVSEEGAIWKVLQGYSKPLEEIFTRYGLSVGLPMVPGATITDYPLKLPYRFLEDHALKELNIAVGEAHEGFCRAKRDVEVLERQLKETGAREKFESA
jgi:exonuclease VII large subunit